MAVRSGRAVRSRCPSFRRPVAAAAARRAAVHLRRPEEARGACLILSWLNQPAAAGRRQGLVSLVQVSLRWPVRTRLATFSALPVIQRSSRAPSKDLGHATLAAEAPSTAVVTAIDFGWCQGRPSRPSLCCMNDKKSTTAVTSERCSPDRPTGAVVAVATAAVASLVVATIIGELLSDPRPSSTLLGLDIAVGVLGCAVLRSCSCGRHPLRSGWLPLPRCSGRHAAIHRRNSLRRPGTPLPRGRGGGRGRHSRPRHPRCVAAASRAVLTAGGWSSTSLCTLH